MDGTEQLEQRLRQGREQAQALSEYAAEVQPVVDKIVKLITEQDLLRLGGVREVLLRKTK